MESPRGLESESEREVGEEEGLLRKNHGRYLRPSSAGGGRSRTG